MESVQNFSNNDVDKNMEKGVNEKTWEKRKRKIKANQKNRYQ